MKKFAVAALGIALSVAMQAESYEYSSHAELTYRAGAASLVTSDQFRMDFGLYGATGQLTLPKKYWDIGPDGETARVVDQPKMDPSLFESFTIQGLGHETGLEDQLRGWMLRGAIREDDIGAVVDPMIMRWKILTPFDDPYFPSLIRPVNHFFDPAKNGVGLQGFLLTNATPLPASDWMLGVSGAFGTATPDPARRNHFSIRDAREAQWRMLTGTRANGTPIPQEERLAYVTTLFRALGDSLHLIQDMAQPQHTRNDSHVSGSVYEDRVNHRITIDALARLTQPSLLLPPVDYGTCGNGGTFCPVMLRRYADYFSTSINNVAAGRGMADYSNRGFFSEGTSLGNNTYTLPSNTIADYQQVAATNDYGNPITLLAGPVPDLVFTQEQGVKLTGFSAWDESMTEVGGPRTTQLYSQNYDEQARLLVPRAVAYSAGLLNYFFRGTIDIKLPAEQVFAVANFKGNLGFKYLKASIKNTTPAVDGVGQATGSPGKLYAVLSYRKNKCAIDNAGYPTLSSWPHLDGNGQLVWDEGCRSPKPDSTTIPDVVVSDGVDVPADFDTAYSDVTFTFATPLPFDALDVDLRIVYRGPLGLEDDAIAMGWERYVTEPNFLDFQNNKDCGAGCSVDNPDCWMSASVKLPFWNADDAPGWRQVAAVTDLKPGQYARVGFLTHEGYRLTSGSTGQVLGEVLTNQNYPFQADVRYPDGSLQVRPPGVTIVSAFVRSRNVTVPQGGALYSWMVYGNFVDANTCPAPIDPTPQDVTIMFP